MLTFKNEVRNSPIHGQGLFTLEPLQAEKILWVFNPQLDKKYTPEEFSRLSAEEKQKIWYWGYQDALDNQYYLTGDNDRYTNHSVTPNTYIDSEGQVRAVRDIAPGEEVTGNYKDFNMDPTSRGNLV